LRSPEGQIVLGAAVIDDVIGLVIFSVVGGIVGGVTLSIAGIAVTTAIAVGFIAAALILGRLVVPPVFHFIDRLEASGTLGVAGLTFAFLLAWLASLAGSATIIGAFAAGILLHNTPQRARIESATTTLGLFFVPIFFAAVGAEVVLGAFSDVRVVAIGLALLAAALVGKIASGYAPFWLRGRKLLIGVAMVPRGEVGLIFAQMGLATAALTSELFSAITMTVLATTLLTPPLLAYMIRAEPHTPDKSDRPGSGGIDDLVAGTAEMSASRPSVEPASSSDTSTSP
jgi:Kef-type K+ transport system membrane component KefB